MLPLIVFTIGFGAALTKVSDERRAGVVNFFKGLADAMMVLISVGHRTRSDRCVLHSRRRSGRAWA